MTDHPTLTLSSEQLRSIDHSFTDQYAQLQRVYLADDLPPIQVFVTLNSRRPWAVSASAMNPNGEWLLVHTTRIPPAADDGKSAADRAAAYAATLLRHARRSA